LNSSNRVGRGKGIFQTYFQRLLETVALKVVIALRSALAPLSVLLDGHRFFFWDAFPLSHQLPRCSLTPFFRIGGRRLRRPAQRENRSA